MLIGALLIPNRAQQERKFIFLGGVLLLDSSQMIFLKLLFVAVKHMQMRRRACRMSCRGKRDYWIGLAVSRSHLALNGLD